MFPKCFKNLILIHNVFENHVFRDTIHPSLVWEVTCLTSGIKFYLLFKDYRLRRKKSSDKRYFINTLPHFSDSRFNIWKAMFVMFLQRINHEMWEIIVHEPFILTHQVNDEVLDKPNFLWSEELKRRHEIDFKNNSFINIYLDDRKIYYVHQCNTSKKVWDTLEMICGALQVSNKRR